MVCHRGDVYWAELPGQGGGPQVRYPVLIVQNDEINEHFSTAIIAGMGIAVIDKPHKFVVQLNAGEGGLNGPGYVDCSHLVTLNQQSLKEKAGFLNEERMLEVDESLRYSLSLAGAG